MQRFCTGVVGAFWRLGAWGPSEHQCLGNPVLPSPRVGFYLRGIRSNTEFSGGTCRVTHLPPCSHLSMAPAPPSALTSLSKGTLGELLKWKWVSRASWSSVLATGYFAASQVAWSLCGNPCLNNLPVPPNLPALPSPLPPAPAPRAGGGSHHRFIQSLARYACDIRRL